MDSPDIIVIFQSGCSSLIFNAAETPVMPFPIIKISILTPVASVSDERHEKWFQKDSDKFFQREGYYLRGVDHVW